MPLQLITPPALEPVSLAEANAHLRLETSVDDAAVISLIIAARHHVEQMCWRGLVTQTWELVATGFPFDSCSPIAQQGFELSMGNLSSVASLKYIDPNGVEQTMPSADYAADAVAVPGRLRLAYGKSWPSYRQQWDAVRIRYAVGWAPGAVPQPIKQAMLLLISQMYEHRTPEVTGTIVSAVSFAVEALLGPYRLVRF
ncbi:MAG: head-tail connector protein [Patescibacteria group bacterium]